YNNKFVSNRTDLQNLECNRLDEKEIESIQFEMRGSLTNYIVNREEKDIYIVPDPLGLSIVFYYLSPNLKIYSNSIKEIASILEKFEIKLNKNIEYFFESLVMGNGGMGHNPYKEIIALDPFNYIKIKKNTIQTKHN